MDFLGVLDALRIAILKMKAEVRDQAGAPQTLLFRVGKDIFEIDYTNATRMLDPIQVIAGPMQEARVQMRAEVTLTSMSEVAA